MKNILATFLVLASTSVAAYSQQQSFEDIVLDAQKFNALYLELRKLPVTADVHEALKNILISLENQAIQEKKAKADTVQDKK